MPGTSHQKLWRNYRDFSGLRGQLVADIFAQHLALKGATILDAGCGSGGISRALAERGAKVIAVDIHAMDAQKLGHARPTRESLPGTQEITWLNHSIETLTLEAACDGIVLWDVLEHLSEPLDALKILQRSLKNDGTLLIATPNRGSWINALCDPHYGLPLVSLLPRNQVRRIVAVWLGWHDRAKPDFPELLSLAAIGRILTGAGFSWRFINRQVFAVAMENPRGLWNRSWHLHLIALVHRLGLTSLLGNLVSDRIGWMNRCTMPTFFILARKR